MAKKMFTFHVDYFKASGKWYTHADFEYECEILSSDENQPYMDDVVDQLKWLKSSGGKNMPGLVSSRWNGYMTVRYKDGFPTLILM